MTDRDKKILSAIKFVSVMIVSIAVIALMVFVSSNNPVTAIFLATLILLCTVSLNVLGKMRNGVKYQSDAKEVYSSTIDDINLYADVLAYLVAVIMMAFTVFKCSTIVGG